MLRRSVSPLLGEVAGRVLPSSLRRFTEVPDWETAARASLGYEAFVEEHGVQTYAEVDLSAPGRPQTEAQFLAALAMATSARDGESALRVVDLGGAAGHLHAVARAAFPRHQLDWKVVETAAAVAVHSQHPHPPDVSWHADRSEALSAGADLVVASAFLNYVPDPYDVLRSLPGRARYLFATRLPLWPIDHDIPAIQKSRSLSRRGSYPTWFFSERGFMDVVHSLGTVLARFEVPEDAAFMAHHYLTYSGLLIRIDEGSAT